MGNIKIFQNVCFLGSKTKILFGSSENNVCLINIVTNVNVHARIALCRGKATLVVATWFSLPVNCCANCCITCSISYFKFCCNKLSYLTILQQVLQDETNLDNTWCDYHFWQAEMPPIWSSFSGLFRPILKDYQGMHASIIAKKLGMQCLQFCRSKSSEVL